MALTLQRRDLLSAGAMSLAALREARAGEAMTRVLVVGDSQAQGLAAGLQRQFRGDASWRVIDRSRIATGLCSPSRFDWPAAAAGIGEAERGAIAIVMFGANDRPPVRSHGQVDEKLLASFTASYGASVRTIAEALRRSCPALIWVGHPIVRDPVYAADMVLLNRIFAEQAVRGGGEWFASWPLFVDADGAYAPYGKGTDGQTTRLRADDGVHCTAAGYDVLARALVPVIGLYRPGSPHV
ncbi:MAG: DUF459 domain-containing protein [Acetobacteraceae bacterium]